jgi:hypothetical protein
LKTILRAQKTALSENMVRSGLLGRGKKTACGPSSTRDVSHGRRGNASPTDPEVDARDRNFTFADAEVLAEKLMEQSRRSKIGFFKQEQPRRPIKLPHSVSDEYLLDGIQAPTSTPDMLFLSRYPSTISAVSGRPSFQVGREIAKGSIAETLSTVADAEVALSIETSTHEIEDGTVERSKP